MASEGMKISAVEFAAGPKPAPVKNAPPRPEKEKAPEKEPAAVQKKLDPDFLEKVTRELNNEFRIFNTAMSFSVDGNTGRTVIKILDRETEKVVREIPPDEMLRIAAKLTEVIGRIVDETA